MARLQLPKSGVLLFLGKKMVSLWPSFASKDANPNIPIDFNREKSHSKLNENFLMYFYLNAVKVHPVKYKPNILEQCK